MKSVSSIVAEASKGLVGDRYHGTRHRHVTVQSAESLAEASERLGLTIEPWMTRRNLTLDHGRVPRNPGDRLLIGDDVLLEVVRIAAPCRLLDDVIGQGAARALHLLAGSVCRVLAGGELRLTDRISFEKRPELEC